MISVKIFTSDELICGYQIEGHSGLDESGRDILCAFVSSAAYMTANTLTDIIHAKADIEVNDGFMKLVLESCLSESQQILKGFRLHLESLAADYPNNIKVTSIRRCQNA